MRRIIWAEILLISFLFCPAVGHGDTIPGYDCLGLAMYCDNYLAAPKLPALGTLLNTFGNPLPCIEKRIQAGGLKVVETDLIDATCKRNSNCPPGAADPSDIKVIKQRAAQVSALAVKYPAIEFWISPALEHDVKDPSKVAAMFSAAKAGCPTCKMINTVMTGAKIGGIPLEQHGTNVRGFSVSSDGASIFDGDNMSSDGNGFEHRTSGFYMTYAWFPELNLRCSGEKTFTPPLKRTNKPTPDLFKEAFLTMQPEQPMPPAPSKCKSVRGLIPKKEIYKPNAEAYCNGQKPDVRGNKPLLIIKRPGRQGDRLPIFSSTGNQVGCFLYWDTYIPMPGTARYYVGNCSGQTAAALYDALDGEWAYIGLGGGACLRTNIVRRGGVYR